jgi:hypothetical protein
MTNTAYMMQLTTESIQQALLSAGVPPVEHDACLTWAIGPDWGSLSFGELGQRIKRLSPAVHCGMPVAEAFAMVGQAYLRHQAEEKAGAPT